MSIKLNLWKLMAIKFVEMIVAQPPTHIKVSSVQEPCAKCFMVHTYTCQNLKSCKPDEKTKQKTEN